MIGSIEFYDSVKKFGSIRSTFNSDVFFFTSDIVPGVGIEMPPRVGCVVSFAPVKSSRGGFRAKELILLGYSNLWVKTSLIDNSDIVKISTSHFLELIARTYKSKDIEDAIELLFEERELYTKHYVLSIER